MNREDEAIATMLEIDGIAMSSGIDDENPLLESARKCLARALRTESLRDGGWWFNTDRMTLHPAQGGVIYVPNDCLKIDVIRSPQHCNLVKRGDRLYDRANETDDIGEEVDVEMVRLLDIDDVPEQFFSLVLASACQMFAANPLGSTQASSEWERKRAEAYWEMQREHSRQMRPRIDQCCHRGSALRSIHR